MKRSGIQGWKDQGIQWMLSVHKSHLLPPVIHVPEPPPLKPLQFLSLRCQLAWSLHQEPRHLGPGWRKPLSSGSSYTPTLPGLEPWASCTMALASAAGAEGVMLLAAVGCCPVVEQPLEGDKQHVASWGLRTTDCWGERCSGLAWVEDGSKGCSWGMGSWRQGGWSPLVGGCLL